MRSLVASCIAVVFAMLIAPSAVLGDIVFTGTVTPDAPSQTNVTTSVLIGPQNSGETALDPRGTVAVTNGSQWEVGQVLVGASDLALARMTVSGAGTKASVTRSGSPTSPTLGVAQRGSGHLRVDSGAWLAVGSTQQSIGTMTLGPYFSQPPVWGPATAEITGEGTLLTIGSQLILNGATTTKMRVTDGAVVRVGASNNTNESTVTVVGELIVTGEWSELQTGGITIGSLITGPSAGVGGLVKIGAGAIVRPYGQSFTGSASIAPFGVLDLEGGAFALPLRQVQGVVRGTGSLTRDINLIDGGSIEVGDDDSLRLDGILTSRGRVLVEGGRLDVYGDFTNDDAGETGGTVEITNGSAGFYGRSTSESSMRLVGSEVEFNNVRTADIFLSTGTFYAEESQIISSDAITNRGVFELVNSSLQIKAGSIRNEPGSREAARLILENGQILAGTPIYNSPLYNGGVIEARAGRNVVQPRVVSNGPSTLLVGAGAVIAFRDSADFYQGVTLGAEALVEAANQFTFGNQLSVEVSEANRSRPLIDCESFVYLSGSLQVALNAELAPTVGQIFSLITAEHINGAFSQLSLPDLPGTLEFVPQLSETELSLLVIDAAVALPGDYNADGCVDAADYTLLRDSEMQATNPMAVVTWQTNYGRWLPGSGMPIPEPTAVVVVAIGLATVAASRR